MIYKRHAPVTDRSSSRTAEITEDFPAPVFPTTPTMVRVGFARDLRLLIALSHCVAWVVLREDTASRGGLRLSSAFKPTTVASSRSSGDVSEAICWRLLGCGSRGSAPASKGEEGGGPPPGPVAGSDFMDIVKSPFSFCQGFGSPAIGYLWSSVACKRAGSNEMARASLKQSWGKA
jgi:hypothetical protein